MAPSLLLFAWALGKAIPVFLVKGLCIHFIAAPLLLALDARAARRRYGVLGLALAACVAVFVADVAVAYGQVLALAGSVSPAAALRATSPTSMLMPASTGATFWPVWLALAWLAGAALTLLRVGAGLAWLRHVLRASRPWDDAAWQACVASMARQMRVPRAVGLRIVRGLSTPVTAGWLKPVILVPAHIVTGMPADLLQALLAHELAHVRRLDYLMNLLQHLAEALLFFHPSVWWLSRRLRIERECIADEMAASVIDSPRQLARALDALSRHPAGGAAGQPIALGAGDGRLADRIRRLLRPARLPARRTLALPMLAALLAMAGISVWSGLGQARVEAAVATRDARQALADYPDIAALIEASGAAHMLVVDSASGDRLAGRAENDVVPIASLTKLMTAMVVLDATTDLDARIAIEAQDAVATREGMAGLPVGSIATRGTLLKLALMSSDNRAAYALARSYPGGMAAFSLALRGKMAALRLSHTTLTDPTGISPANRSSAADIERIVNAAAGYPEIVRDTVLPAQSVALGAGVVHYRNTNPLVGRAGWDIRLSKTGASDDAGRCLVMRVHVKDRDLTLVLLNAGRPPG